MNEIVDPFIGKILADKYRIDSVMRETEFGKVYYATHLSMEKPVVVKILAPALAVDEKIVSGFSAEAKSVSALSHVNILNVTDFGSDTNGVVYIVYEDAPGENLKLKIRENGMFMPDHAIRIAKQIAAALSAAHAKGIVHGGLTSSGILVGDEASVKVLDLGTLRNDSFTESEDGGDGRIEYLSPEQCADSHAADARSDIYSVGVVLYEMLAGEVPFKAENTAELMLKHAQEPPPPMSAFRADLPPTIEPLILQALAKNPEMRHQSATELFDDLNHVERTLGEIRAAGATATSGNNNIWKTAFVVLCGISLLSAFMIWMTSSRQTDPSTLKADTNSRPVQPINPASGVDEQRFATMVPMSSDFMSNSNMPMTMPDQIPGGDGYNPWGNGVQPPPGAPPYIPQPGGYVDPNNPNSPFNQDDPTAGGKIVQGPDGNYYYLVAPTPTPNANSNVSTKPTPKPGKSPNANTPATDPTPAPQDTPKPAVTPTPGDTKPAATPKPTDKPKPTTSTKPPASGKTQDS